MFHVEQTRFHRKSEVRTIASLEKPCIRAVSLLFSAHLGDPLGPRHRNCESKRWSWENNNSGKFSGLPGGSRSADFTSRLRFAGKRVGGHRFSEGPFPKNPLPCINSQRAV